MDFFKTHYLTLLTMLPLFGALVMLLLPRDENGQLRGFALFMSFVGIFAALPLIGWYDKTAGGIQLEQRVDWLPAVGISYHVGVDGIAVVLILLTAFLFPIVIASTFGSIQTRVKELMIALLVLQTAMIGTFVAMDLVLFYVFWELMLVPMYLIIGVWGSERRIYAAVKLFIFTAAGSLLMLAAILYMYWQTKGIPGAVAASFDYTDFLKLAGTKSITGAPLLTNTAQALLFGAFAIAFAIKVPIFPLHTWLPDAHVQAPAAGSIVLAGVLLKMGTFGLVRYAMPLFPQATETYAPLVGWLGVIGIVYGSLMSMAQDDMKKLIAYSSVAHLGYVVVGLMARTKEGATGAVLQMLNHGISTGALFLLVGYMYERRHTRQISAYGGQAKVTPMMAAIFAIVTFSSIGLPGTNGFVGEFLVLTGTYVSPMAQGRIWAVVASTGVILGAVYMLTLFQKVYLGPVTNPEVSATKDLNGRELSTLLPLVAMIIIMGVLPQPFIDYIQQPVTAFADSLSPGKNVAVAEAAPMPNQPFKMRKIKDMDDLKKRLNPSIRDIKPVNQ